MVLALIGVGSLLAGPRLHADESAEAVSPMVKAADDPLALARLVERWGDLRVLERVGDESAAVQERLGAIRATRWLRAPEHALAPLVALAAGRDPHLAPAAAEAAHTIAVALEPAALARREVAWSELTPVEERLRALSSDGTARSDVRYVAGFAADALARLEPSAEGAAGP
jgi:hypothetical protein